MKDGVAFEAPPTETSPSRIGATIDVASAASCMWDVVVAGAGPAGALAARETARRGLRTLLVDRSQFPRAKVCGGCLNARSLAILDFVGLGDLPRRCGGAPTRSVRIAVAGKSLTLPMTRGWSVSRETFDAALVREAIAAGASFLPGVRVQSGDLIDDAREVALLSPEGAFVASTRVLLAADGLGGKVFGDGAPPSGRSRVGGGVVLAYESPAYPAGSIAMACGRDGYVGIVPVERGRLDVAGAFDPAAVKRRGLGPLAASIAQTAGLPEIPGLAAADWRGTPLLTRRAREVSGIRLLSLGDAAGYVEPITGEGMAWAMASATIAAEFAAAGVDAWSPDISARWSREHRDLVERRTWFCRTISGLLRSPAAVRSAFVAAGLAPRTAAALLRWLDRLPPGLELRRAG